MKIKTAQALLAILLVATGLATAEEKADGEHHGKHHFGAGMSGHDMPDPARMVRHISHQLELDESLSQELVQIVQTAKPQLLALHEKARANRVAIEALDIDGSDYSEQIRALAVESGEIATERTLLMSQLRVDIRARLTPEQRQKLAETKSAMRRNREGWRHQRHDDRHQHGHDEMAHGGDHHSAPEDAAPQ